MGCEKINIFKDILFKHYYKYSFLKYINNIFIIIKYLYIMLYGDKYFILIKGLYLIIFRNIIKKIKIIYFIDFQYILNKYKKSSIILINILK